jgi:hypothetical protein
MKLVGTETTFNEGGNDKDFRVESDTITHALFVDGASGNVSIGSSTAYGTSKLSLFAATNPTTASSSAIQLSIGEASQNSSYSLKVGYINIGGGYSSSIQSIAGGNPSTLLLNADGGKVGIGTSDPARTLSIWDTVNGYNLELQQRSAYNSGNQSGVVFSAKYHSDGSITDLASIRGGKDNTTDGDYGGKVAIWTRPNGGSDTAVATWDSQGGFTTTPRGAGDTVFNENGVDSDFRVESDGNANALFVDGGANHIGMGTATLNRSGLGADHIVLTVGADTEMGMLELQGTRTSDADLGRISFLNAGTRRAEIVAARIDADNSTKLYFQTSDAGSLGTRLTIGKDGAATFNSSVSTGGDIILPSTGKLYSSGDTDSFLQFNQPNTLRAIIGDSTRMIIEPNTTVFNEDSADVDFRVESDNDANAFFVQGSNGFVGIGTGSPVSITGAAGPILDMQGPNPEIVFHDNDGTANAMSMYYLNDTLRWWGDGAQNMSLDNSGNLTVAGALSKGSGSFKIDHPLPAKTETHNLVHSFIEGPQADNIYRGKVTLVDGSATVNIDTVSGMSEGTYVLLNTNTQCFTSNESGWTAVKGSVAGNILTIEAQESCSDTISWMVVGERHDQHMLDTEWTDENGKVIVEPLKELES